MKTNLSRLVFFVAFFASSPCLSSQAQPAGGHGQAPPAGGHGSLSCDTCHPDSENVYIDCLECHEKSEHIHPVSKAPSFEIPEDFPLFEGDIYCPTCHKLHAPTGRSLLRNFDNSEDGNLMAFCVLCHEDGFAKANPHRAKMGTGRCVFCHVSIDEEAIFHGTSPISQKEPERLCNFCHDLRSTNHPRNIDPVMEVPEGLPRDANGEITCVTCHDPHGSSSNTHYVRQAYAEHFVRLNEYKPHKNDRFSCRSCHVDKPENITKGNRNLRFQDDVTMLCISCHARSRNHHPVGSLVPDKMQARLKEKGGLPLEGGTISCITCHSTNCSSGDLSVSVRYYNSYMRNLSLCWFCHDKEEGKKVNPHKKSIEKNNGSCNLCHDRPPVKGMSKSGDLYFITDFRMMCNLCHGGAGCKNFFHVRKKLSQEMEDNLTAFCSEKNVSFVFGPDDIVTCVTCHNAHFSADSGENKTRYTMEILCPACHTL